MSSAACDSDGDFHCDVCVFVEGAYPFVVGGVSSWLQDLMLSLPDMRFTIVAIKAKDEPLEWRVAPPPNVVEIVEMPLSFEPSRPHGYPARQIERIGHLLLDFLLAGDRLLLMSLSAELAALKPRPTVGDILASPAIFTILTQEYAAKFPAASFHHFFWAMRVLLGGLLATLLTPLPRARVYHTLSTGFAGLMAARAEYETGRPSFITEHGLYLLEREIEVMMADWIGDQIDTGLMLDRDCRDLRDLWLAAFQSYARACYDACDPIIALYRANNATQLRLGARRERLLSIPNGINPDRFADMIGLRDLEHPLVALIGRVVPIKDIKTFIRAAALVNAELPHARFVVLGPQDEDSNYAADCDALVAELGIGAVFQFAGRVNIVDWMSRIDILVLTSLSEAQPLVILEGGACGIPVVATDVGSCREMLEGRGDHDNRAGGIITALVNPKATADAVMRLARDAVLRADMGASLRHRVRRDYNYENVVAEYRRLYGQ